MRARNAAQFARMFVSPYGTPSCKSMEEPQNAAGVIRMQDILQREPKTSPEPSQREGTVARTIEQQTAKIPSDWFLWAALGSIGASLIFTIAGAQKKANFIGQWAPTLLILGMYNKMVKLHGSDSV
jgi:hypothetical protein